MQRGGRLPTRVLRLVREWARLDSGTSVAEIVREAVERHLEDPAATGSLSFFAIGEGGPVDASERVDEYVAAAVRKRSRDRE